MLVLHPLVHSLTAAWALLTDSAAATGTSLSVAAIFERACTALVCGWRAAVGAAGAACCMGLQHSPSSRPLVRLGFLCSRGGERRLMVDHTPQRRSPVNPG